MREILAKSNVDILHQFACSNVVLAFDFDGTLAPIVDEPGAARMRERTREALERLCKVYPCIVISGRAQADAARRVRGVGLQEVIGNHGLEPWRRTEEFSEQVRRWIPSLERSLSRLRGVKIEDKLFSVAIHYRQSREKKAARAAILEAVVPLQPLRVIGGDHVVNLIPDGAPHKGIALGAARERLRCDTAVYIGDDETDEDVFSLNEPGRLLAIRVGERQGSAAPFFIRNQDCIDELMGVLLSARAQVQAKVRA